MEVTCCLNNEEQSSSKIGHSAGASRTIEIENHATKMQEKTILFVPMNSIGHTNSLIGIANSLRQRGHRTVFLFHQPPEMLTELKEIGHEVYDCINEGLVPSTPLVSERNEAKDEIEKKMQHLNSDNEIVWLGMAMKYFEKLTTDTDQIFAGKLALINPNSLILDTYYVQPAILKYGKPWSLIYSASPLSLHPRENHLPEAYIGAPTNWLSLEDKLKEHYSQLGQRFRQLRQNMFDNWIKYLHDEHQISVEEEHIANYIQISPFLNVYMYPKHLDYDEPLLNWIRCDSMLRNNSWIGMSESEAMATNKSNIVREEKAFEIPAQLRSIGGKLIFVSMGTVASINANLMKTLVDILSKSPNRFIVSMGSNCDKFELAANMWGQRHVNQLAILPVIDMIITHGGNNTITECFYYGVPGFIVCPSFGDQKDNARRIEECKLGKWVDPFDCDQNKFLASIEEVLADETIRPRMKAFSERMQLPENKYKAIRLFTEFVERH